MKNNKEIAEFYDTYKEHQQKVAYNDRHIYLRDQLKLYVSNKSSKILEVGCGVGIMSSLILKLIPEGNLVGIDISPKSIEIARINCGKYNNANFIAGDICESSFTVNNFDFILLFDVLEHIPLQKHQILFSTLANLMKTDARLIINVPYAPYHEYVIKNMKEQLQIIEEPVYLHNLSAVLNDSNMEIKEVHTYGLWQKDEYQLSVITTKREYEPKELVRKRRWMSFISSRFKL